MPQVCTGYVFHFLVIAAYGEITEVCDSREEAEDLFNAWFAANERSSQRMRALTRAVGVDQAGLYDDLSVALYGVTRVAWVTGRPLYEEDASEGDDEWPESDEDEEMEEVEEEIEEMEWGQELELPRKKLLLCEPLTAVVPEMKGLRRVLSVEGLLDEYDVHPRTRERVPRTKVLRGHSGFDLEPKEIVYTPCRWSCDHGCLCQCVSEDDCTCSLRYHCGCFDGPQR